MKKTIVIIMVICLLFPNCISNNAVVKADECPGDYQGIHRWSAWELDDWFPDCTKGLVYTRYCTQCFQEQTVKAKPMNHSWGKMKTKRKPTYYEDGKKTHVCTVCGKRQNIVIPHKKMNKNVRKARRVVLKYLKYAKKYKWKKMDKCFKNRRCYEGYPTYKPLVKSYRRLNKKMYWYVEDIDGKGKSMTVKVYVEFPNMYKSIYNAYRDNIYYCIKHGRVSARKLGDRIIDDYDVNLAIDDVKMKRMKVKFKTVKTKKGWKIRKKTITMVDIATCRYATGTYDAEMDFNVDFVD